MENLRAKYWRELQRLISLYGKKHKVIYIIGTCADGRNWRMPVLNHQPIPITINFELCEISIVGKEAARP